VKIPKAPAQLLELTFHLLAAGQLKEAHRACRKAVQARPDLPEAHLLLSEIHHQGGDSAKARESASRALRLRPGWSEAYVGLGNAEVLAGNLKPAEEHFRAAIAAGSPAAGVHANLGHVLLRQGRLEEARDAYEVAASRDPSSAELQLNVAMILSELGQKAEALELMLAAAERFPDSAQVQFVLGNQLTDLRRYEDAASRYRRAIDLEPSFSAARFNLARALFAMGRSEEAIAGLYELLNRDANASEVREQLLKLLHINRRFREMETVAREGMAIHPAALVYPHLYGVSLWWQERHEDALELYAMVDRLAKDHTTPAYQEAKLEQASALLLLGRWREGWEAYRWRPPRAFWRAKFPQLIDDPRTVDGFRGTARILIMGEQGLGDELFFLRFAKWLRERGHQLRGCFDKKLLPLLADLPNLFDQLTHIYDPSSIDADVTLLSGDLPLAVRQDIAPALALPVDPARREIFEARLRQFGPPPYIGVTWRGGALQDERKGPMIFFLEKEVTPAELAAVLRPLSATVVILQRRPSVEDQERFLQALGRPALDLSAVNDDLRDALAVLSVLDEYVGVSNTNTHLRAGLAGKTARILVQHPPEWRWGVGVRSTWFPDFPTYRQDRDGNWTAALSALAADLAPYIAA
jgi:Flp pilus assembly protein TadD